MRPLNLKLLAQEIARTENVEQNPGLDLALNVVAKEFSEKADLMLLDQDKQISKARELVKQQALAAVNEEEFFHELARSSFAEALAESSKQDIQDNARFWNFFRPEQETVDFIKAAKAIGNDEGLAVVAEGLLESTAKKYQDQIYRTYADVLSITAKNANNIVYVFPLADSTETAEDYLQRTRIRKLHILQNQKPICGIQSAASPLPVIKGLWAKGKSSNSLGTFHHENVEYDYCKTCLKQEATEPECLEAYKQNPWSPEEWQEVKAMMIEAGVKDLKKEGLNFIKTHSRIKAAFNKQLRSRAARDFVEHHDAESAWVAITSEFFVAQGMHKNIPMTRGIAEELLRTYKPDIQNPFAPMITRAENQARSLAKNNIKV